jgi:hypothetical protein
MQREEEGGARRSSLSVPSEGMGERVPAFQGLGRVAASSEDGGHVHRQDHDVP